MMRCTKQSGNPMKNNVKKTNTSTMALTFAHASRARIVSGGWAFLFYAIQEISKYS